MQHCTFVQSRLRISCWRLGMVFPGFRWDLEERLRLGQIRNYNSSTLSLANG